MRHQQTAHPRISDRLRQTINLWRKPGTPGEGEAARSAIARLAEREGMSPLEAIKAFHLELADPNNLFAGIAQAMDDQDEWKHPGYKAKRAHEKQEKVAARLARRQALIEMHGSFEAAIAPCEREQLLRDAVMEWRVPCDPSSERWTDNLDGWNSWIDQAPQHVVDAIRGAYPIPETVMDALAELDYWETRDREMADLLEDQYGDDALDLVAVARKSIVRDLARSGLPARSAADVLARMRYLQKSGSLWSEEESARLVADMEGLAAKEHMTSQANVSTPVHSAQAEPTSTTCPVVNGQIPEALRANPSRSDRSIAREFNASPTTVGKVRKALGLQSSARSVQRRGRSYNFHPRSSVHAPHGHMEG